MNDQTTMGYFDLQVNGYGGIDFQDPNLQAQGLHGACARLEADGVDGILATITTDHVEQMAARLGRLVELREADPLVERMIAGFHIEGPFISPEDGYRGAHPADAVQPADPDVMRTLLDAAGGLTRIVTLAPEHDPRMRTTRLLADQGITVSAGHCNPTLDQLDAAIDAGLGMFTHLGNGCPKFIQRHENIIQYALSRSDRLWLGFIADGVHVALPALGNYLRAAGLDRCFVVTDAVTPAGLGPGQYTFGRWSINVGQDLAIRAPDNSHLVGSAIVMNRAVENLTEGVHLTADQAHQLTAVNPRRVMKI